MITALHGIVDSSGADRGPFISEWTTYRLSPSTANIVYLPYVPGACGSAYSGIIDWGDGTTSINSYENRGHTYGASAIYTISISGVVDGWDHYTNGNSGINLLTNQNLRKIKRWGNLRLDGPTRSPVVPRNDGRTSFFFNGCENLNMSEVEDLPDLSGIWSLDSLFFACSGMTSVNRITEWDLSNIYSVLNMFNGCLNFDQNLSALDVSNVLDFDRMFTSCAIFNNGGSTGIGDWNMTGATGINDMFSYAYSFNQPIGNWDITSMTALSSVFFNARSFNQDLSSWDTSSIVDMWNLFAGATAFNNGGSTGIGDWDVSLVTNMSGMFNDARTFNQPLSGWDTSSVTDMTSMFNAALAFNQNLGSFDTSSVTNMDSMFSSATLFNNGGSTSIGGWDTSSVTNMGGMFNGAYAFNQPLDDWSTSLVTQMVGMFSSAHSFNQNIGGFDVSSVTDMSSMFKSAGAFNNGGAGNIGGWTTTLVNNMANVFQGATSFNQALGWSTTNVTDMTNMFNVATSFDQPFGGSWDTVAVQSFSGMFDNATSFNQTLNFDFSSAADTSYMFNGATAFNNGGVAPIWTTNQVQNMEGMFRNATSFNQSLADLDVWALTSAAVMLDNCGMSTANYDATLVGWQNQSINYGVSANTMGAQNLTYTSGGAGGAARTHLITSDGWSFSGDVGI